MILETLKEKEKDAVEESSCTIDATIKSDNAIADSVSNNVVAKPDTVDITADVNTEKADAKEPISQTKLDGVSGML